LPFALASFLAALWITGAIMEHASLELTTRVWWFRFQAIWQPPTVTAMTCFVLEYTWPGRWLSRRNVVLLYLPSIAFALVVVAGNPGNLAWRSIVTAGQIAPIRGPLNWFTLIYAYGLAIVEVLALVWLFSSSRLHRWQAAIMLGTKIAARSTYLLRAVGLADGTRLSDDLIIGFVAIWYAMALFAFRVFDPVGQARQLAVAQMQEGMLVLDTAGKVASINAAARMMLDLGDINVVGQDASSVRSVSPKTAGVLASVTSDWADLPTTGLAASRQIIFRAQDLTDFRGVVSGRLILLRDVTAERRAQTQLLDQQRSIATLAERDRLAREMHDSLGQTLAAARLQASTAGLMLEQGDSTAAQQSIAAIATIARDAEIDIRDYIVGARTFATPDMPFFTKLERYLGNFGPQHGLDVRLTVGPEIGRGGFTAAMENQLLRIVQEALSNVRKHAAATSVKVTFTLDSGNLELMIADDGRGFDPTGIAPAPGEGYGLQTMRERAESLQGTFEIRSQPGQGTEIVVTVPLKGAGLDE
jgi:signal transduction histidine kinase